MTFSAQVKNEISESLLNEIENRYLLLGYIFMNAEYNNDKTILSLENMSIARKIFKTLKYSFKLDVNMTVRVQKKFILKRLFIFEIPSSKEIFTSELNTMDQSDKEGMISFIKGTFLASGSINDPKKSQYHLEILFKEEKKALYVQKILDILGYNFHIIKREKGFMLYLKASEEISDFLKLLGAVNSLFYFEDIRIYRDHKNMVNRLNNCEQANYEKSLKTSDRQLEIIRYLKDNDYYSLLDEKTVQVCEYRLRYPEMSFQALADIISHEIDKKVTKSYINHHFRKINEVYERIIHIDKQN